MTDEQIQKLFAKYNFFEHNVIGKWLDKSSVFAICSDKTVCSTQLICGKVRSDANVIIEIGGNI